MLWLTWRQHRAYLLAAVGLLAALAAILIPTGLHLHGIFDKSVAGCIGQASSRCAQAIDDWTTMYQQVSDPLFYLNLIPASVGVFVGAPLLSREFEQGTHRLAWTQSISRTRWLATELAVLVVATAVFTVPFTTLLTWWERPGVAMFGPMQAGTFDFIGLMPLAHSIFAFTLGAACGGQLTRVVPSMASALFCYLAVFLTIHSWLREHFLSPLVRLRQFGTPAGLRGTDWQLDNSTLVDRAGAVLPSDKIQQMCPSDDTTAFLQCLHINGVMQRQTYQPASRFWTFQGIETSIYVALCVTLIAFTLWRVRAATR